MKPTETKTLPTVSWEAPSFTYIEKTKDWYWVLWIIAGAMAGGAYMLGNFSFMGVILLSAFVLSLLATKKPHLVTSELNNTHVIIDAKKYKISDFEACNLHTDEHRLLLRHVKPYIPIVMIPLGTNGPEGKIRNYLNESAWESDEEITEPFIELLFERLGF